MPDHFERLGLPRRFSVDPASVEREYLARSRAVHPDFHRLGTDAEQRASLELSASLNEAYITLKDWYRRAEYLLGLYGGPTAQQEKNLDQAFLMEMMEIRERIEESPSPADREAIRAELAAREERYQSQIASDLDAVPDPAKLIAVRRALNAVKTIRSLLRDIDED